ncbi:hypothetical protein IEQ34_003199 [Dendrobium chrysotoxum]|uniref:Uncharacterized protein n=1 Tax=Dendrobium chrysotoxum TaxID=161865 RepID=A0AAV7HGH3_DENCH|nr:hypothetical protein IEQ34_003199 [Dendrobium chrysotoxum]
MSCRLPALPLADSSTASSKSSIFHLLTVVEIGFPSFLFQTGMAKSAPEDQSGPHESACGATAIFHELLCAAPPHALPPVAVAEETPPVCITITAP